MATGSAQRSPRSRQLGSIHPSQLLWKLTDAARQFRERRTLSADAALGRRGEDVAHRYLESAGLHVVARNYRPNEGDSEVDIIARDGDIVVFIEVKSRASAEFGDPERAIDGEKKKQIVRAARTYATRAGVAWNQVRFDTISVVFTTPPRIVHQQDSFFGGRAH